MGLNEFLVGRLRRELGLSPQCPLYRAYQRAGEEVTVWKGHASPETQKLDRKQGAIICLDDEASIRSNRHSAATWAPSDQIPVEESRGARFSVNMVTAASTRGALRFMVIGGRMNTQVFIGFLMRLIHRSMALRSRSS